MASGNDKIRLNVGCGATPVEGWVNLDNSLSVRFSRIPGAMKAMARFGLVESISLRVADAAKEFNVRYGSAMHLPFKADSAEVLYSSHMLEHLDRAEARQFLAEALRVLVPGGIIRLAVPDLQMRAKAYVETGDANTFMFSLGPEESALRTYKAKLKFLATGNRGHRWMYDAASLSSLVESCGFVNARSLKAGETTIPEHGKLNLWERAEESIYIEASKPGPVRI